MKSFYPQTKKPAGAASILVTIILSIIVVGMIAGITLLSNQENRQASNTDQSNRALNTAQSKVQTLADQLKTSTTGTGFNTNSCNQDTPPSSGQDDMQITCWTVKTIDAEQTGQVNLDKSIQVDLGHTKTATETVSKIKLDWGLKGADSDWLGDVPFAPYYPVSSSYGARPATLELTFVWYGSKGNSNQFNASDFPNGSLSMKTIVISPDASHCTSTTDGYQCSLSNSLASLIGVPNVDAKNVIMRITARYAGTRYRLSFLNNAGNPVDTYLSQAIIDVTARSGQTYRRIQATKPITYSTFDFAANVLYSGKNICKNLQVYSDHTGAPEGNPNAGKNDPSCEN